MAIDRLSDKDRAVLDEALFKLNDALHALKTFSKWMTKKGEQDGEK